MYRVDRVALGSEWSAAPPMANKQQSSKSNWIGAVCWINKARHPTWSLSTVRARGGLIRHLPCVETMCMTCFIKAFQMRFICHGFQTNHAVHFVLVGCHYHQKGLKSHILLDFLFFFLLYLSACLIAWLPDFLFFFSCLLACLLA